MVKPCHVTPHQATAQPCHCTPWHSIPRQAKKQHTMARHATAGPVTTCHCTTRHPIPRQPKARHALPQPCHCTPPPSTIETYIAKQDKASAAAVAATSPTEAATGKPRHGTACHCTYNTPSHGTPQHIKLCQNHATPGPFTTLHVNTRHGAPMPFHDTTLNITVPQSTLRCSTTMPLHA